jgi:O-antigen/teichoic acid export membrane protein
MVEGTIRVFLGEMLLVPTGLVTAAFLTRKLAPEGYGLFAVAATLVAWIVVLIRHR